MLTTELFADDLWGISQEEPARIILHLGGSNFIMPRAQFLEAIRAVVATLTPEERSGVLGLNERVTDSLPPQRIRQVHVVRFTEEMQVLIRMIVQAVSE